MNRAALAARMSDYFTARTFTELQDRHPGLVEKPARYAPGALWQELHPKGMRADNVVPYLLFPLDIRWLYYEDRVKLLNERRPEFWENLPDNEFFVTVPQPRRKSECRSLIATTLVDLHVHDRGSVCFPRHSSGGGLLTTRAANLHAHAWKVLSSAWKLKGDIHEPAAEAAVADLFRVSLALMHAPQLQQDHADSLAQDWAHVPVPVDRHLFTELAALGTDVAVLLNPDANPDHTFTKYLATSRTAALAKARKAGGGAVSGDDLRVEVSYFGAAKGRWIARAFTPDEQALEPWGEQTGDLYINREVCFANVPERVWTFELGGYPVLKKWLGYRHVERRDGAPITLAELRHFRSMVQRIAAVLAMTASLDAAYARASGAAFTAEGLGVR